MVESAVVLQSFLSMLIAPVKILDSNPKYIGFARLFSARVGILAG